MNPPQSHQNFKCKTKSSGLRLLASMSCRRIAMCGPSLSYLPTHGYGKKGIGALS